MPAVQMADLYPIIFAIIGAIIWLIRLEGRVNYNEREGARLVDENKNLRGRFDESQKELSRQVNEMQRSLSKIEGALMIKQTEVT